MWVHVLGPLVGGAIAGMWKHMNTKIEMELGGIECHPALKDVYAEEQKQKQVENISPPNGSAIDFNLNSARSTARMVGGDFEMSKRT
jgi:hypothetical protein